MLSRWRDFVGAEADGVPVVADDLPTLGKLFQCPYCLSVWVGIFLWCLSKINGSVYELVVMSLFGSAITALIEDYYASNAYS